MSDKKEIVSASPKVRKLAREFGANIYEIKGSQRKGRVSEEDVKSFIKESISGKRPKGRFLAFASPDRPPTPPHGRYSPCRQNRL